MPPSNAVKREVEADLGANVNLAVNVEQENDGAHSGRKRARFHPDLDTTQETNDDSDALSGTDEPTVWFRFLLIQECHFHSHLVHYKPHVPVDSNRVSACMFFTVLVDPLPLEKLRKLAEV